MAPGMMLEDKVRRAAIVIMLLSTVPMPAYSQSASVEKRVGTLEKQMTAVQRKVFPGADPRFFEAEIAAPPAAGTVPGTPASSPLSDLTARVESLEKQLTTLTGQTEQNGYKLRQLEEQLAKFRGDSEFRLNALEGNPGAAAAGANPPNPFTPPGAASTPAPGATGAAAKPVPPADAAEAAYSAAYALVVQKRYVEAEGALKDVVAKYPKHKRASYAQHWLGRSYLADGKPAMAVEAFYANYQNNPRGDRAPDSLYWLGQALQKLNKPTEACKVYGELNDVYGTKINTTLKDQVAQARVTAKCAA